MLLQQPAQGRATAGSAGTRPSKRAQQEARAGLETSGRRPHLWCHPGSLCLSGCKLRAWLPDPGWSCSQEGGALAVGVMPSTALTRAAAEPGLPTAPTAACQCLPGQSHQESGQGPCSGTRASRWSGLSCGPSSGLFPGSLFPHVPLLQSHFFTQHPGHLICDSRLPPCPVLHSGRRSGSWEAQPGARLR